MIEPIEFNELLLEMELTDKARGLSAKTIKKNNKVLKMFFKFLSTEYGLDNISQVKPTHIKKFMVSKVEEGSAESYVNVFLRSIRALFLFAENEGYMPQDKNPTLRVRWMSEKKVMVRAWSNTDIKKMIDYTDTCVRVAKKKVTKTRGAMSLFVAERNKLMVLVLADTGLRVSELCSLKNEDVTPRAVYVNNGKGKKDRSLYSSPQVRKQLLHYNRAKEKYFNRKKDLKIENNIFLSKNGEKLSVDMVERFIKQIGVDAGCDPAIRMSPHTFRHYFTQTQLDNGTSIYDIQRLLGHSSIKTTETYLRSISSDKVLNRGLTNSPLMTLAINSKNESK